MNQETDWFEDETLCPPLYDVIECEVLVIVIQ